MSNQNSQISAPSVWIYNKLKTLAADIDANMSQYRLGAVMDDIYNYVWNDFANWYIEYLKTDKSQIPFAQKHVFEPLIKLIHPFVPFESEVIWDQIQMFYGDSNQKKLLVQETFAIPPMPQTSQNPDEFETIQEFVLQFRRLRGLYRIDPVLKTVLYSNNIVLDKYRDFLALVARVEIQPENQIDSNNKLFKQSFGKIDFTFDLLNLVKEPAIEIERTKKDIQETEAELLKLEKLLQNQGFLEKAGPEKISETKQKMEDCIASIREYQNKLTWLQENN